MTRKRILFLLLTLAWMALIFSFSSQTGTESGGLSAILAEPFTEALADEGLSPEEIEALYNGVDAFIRKTAHVAEYAILGALLCLTSRSFGIFRKLLPYMTGTLYAVTDEIHQAFIPERAARLTDVLIDSAGVALGIAVTLRIIIIWRKRHVRHS